MTQSHYPKSSHSPVGGGSYANNCTEEINKQRFKGCAVDALGKLEEDSLGEMGLRSRLGKRQDLHTRSSQSLNRGTVSESLGSFFLRYTRLLSLEL